MAPAKKNGYVLFAESRKAALQATGQLQNGGLPELLSLCSAEWENLPEERKREFAERAKSFNEQVKGGNGVRGTTPTAQYTSKIPRSELAPPKTSNLVRALDPNMFTSYDTRAHMANQAIVQNMFDKDADWRSQPIVICSFTSYVEPDHDLTYLPAEIGLTAMNLTAGVIDNYARIIDQSPIPKGHGIEAFNTATKLGLPQLGKVPELRDLDPLMTILGNFLEAHKGKLGGVQSDAYYVFCLDSDYLFVTRCLDALFQKTKHYIPVKVLSLDLYAYLASSMGKKASSDTDTGMQAPKEHVFRKLGYSLTGSFIYSSRHPSCALGIFFAVEEVDAVIKQVDNYKYFEELCCVYHIKAGKEIHNCALNLSNRYAFSLLEILTLSNNVPVRAGGHYPELKNPENEKSRRLSLLSKWGISKFEEDMPHYQPNELLGEPTDYGREHRRAQRNQQDEPRRRRDDNGDREGARRAPRERTRFPQERRSSEPGSEPRVRGRYGNIEPTSAAQSDVKKQGRRAEHKNGAGSGYASDSTTASTADELQKRALFEDGEYADYSESEMAEFGGRVKVDGSTHWYRGRRVGVGDDIKLSHEGKGQPSPYTEAVPSIFRGPARPHKKN